MHNFIKKCYVPLFFTKIIQLKFSYIQILGSWSQTVKNVTFKLNKEVMKKENILRKTRK